jgi:hypothetical protein
MFSSPLKPIKETKPEVVKKPKPRISKATAKKLLEVEVADSITAHWLEDYIDNMVRTYSYPPQLVSDDFFGLLTKYFDAPKREEILKAIRNAYNKVSVVEPAPAPPDATVAFGYLLEALSKDPAAQNYLSSLSG